MNICSWPLQNISIPLQLSPSARNKISEIALKTLAELALSLTIGTICALFTATTFGVGLIFMGIIAQTIMNLSVRIFLSYAEHSAEPPPKLARWLTSITFGGLTGFNGQMMIHEAGHCAAAAALLQNPNSRIVLDPFAGGHTFFQPKQLSSLGNLIGSDRIMPIVSAAGPLTALTFSTITLYAGLSLETRAPEASRMLIVASLIDFFVHAIYAFSALYANRANFAHDFISLWAAGIHPIICTIGIIAIPIVVYTLSNKVSLA